jgi:Tol biopolymer transport system component
MTLLAGATTMANQPAEAAFPGLNGKIAFTSNRDGDPEIYVMNATAATERP